VNSQGIVSATLMSNEEYLDQSHEICKVSGIEVVVDGEEDDDDNDFEPLTTPNLQQINSTSSLQDDIDRANAMADYKVELCRDSSKFLSQKNDLAGFHNHDPWDRHRQLVKNLSERSNFSRNLSERSNFSREDSGLSSLYQSEQSDKSSKTYESGYNSTLSGMSNMSPIVMSKHEDFFLSATQEMHEGSDNSIISDNEGHKDKEGGELEEFEDVDAHKERNISTNEVDEWKDYLRKISTERDRDGDDATDEDDEDENEDEDGSECVSDEHALPGAEGTDDEVEGYFLYVTAEGHKIWILTDAARSQEEYNDEEVQSMIDKGAAGGNSSSQGDDEGGREDSDYFSPFHFSKEDALTNVTKVKEFINKQKYEKALVSQQEEQVKKLMAIRQKTHCSIATDEEGNEVEGLSVAERKKLLWNSSGELETNSKI
jgi:hypothetical protein